MEIMAVSDFIKLESKLLDVKRSVATRVGTAYSVASISIWS